MPASGDTPKLSHIDAEGLATMVDVSGKDVTERTATATGSVVMQPQTIALIRDGLVKKGDVLSVAISRGGASGERPAEEPEKGDHDRREDHHEQVMALHARIRHVVGMGRYQHGVAVYGKHGAAAEGAPVPPKREGGGVSCLVVTPGGWKCR